MDFDFKELEEKTSPEFVAHIKSEFMGDEYNSTVAKFEIEKDSERMISVRILEAWKGSTSDPDYTSYTVLVFNFYKARGTFKTEFREIVSLMKNYLQWANV